MNEPHTDLTRTTLGVLFSGQALVTTTLICLLIYLLYRSSGRIAPAIGPTGTNIVASLSAFLLFLHRHPGDVGGFVRLILVTKSQLSMARGKRARTVAWPPHDVFGRAIWRQ